MTDDCLPDHTTPLTTVEKLDAACDWSDFRKDYGVSAAPETLRQEHRAFIAGWTARRNQENR
jgi:hypothetical protein